MIRAMKIALLASITFCAACSSVRRSTPPIPTTAPSRVVTELYEHVTFAAGSRPDWDAVRALFVDEAVIVLRTGRERMSVFTLEGFIDDFKSFIEQANTDATGFTESILDLRETRYRDIARVLVRFDSSIPGDGRPPQEGIDSFELVRIEGEWKIVSIVNERPTREEPIPESLFGG